MQLLESAEHNEDLLYALNGLQVDLLANWKFARHLMQQNFQMLLPQGEAFRRLKERLDCCRFVPSQTSQTSGKSK